MDLIDATLHVESLRDLLHDPDRSLRKRVIQKLGQAGLWDVIQPLMNDPDLQIQQAVVRTMRNGAPLTYLMAAFKNDDASSRRMVIESAVKHQDWAIVWSALDDPDLQIQQVALGGLVTHPTLTADERVRIESHLRAWDTMTLAGSSVLHDLVTRYESTLERQGF